ncbi:hypothetical protein Y886_07745 [Xanthomonas hyacinthi DSM 19077]|nr:ABC transporter permease [Xanthomonas hyacinthi]KLD78884.1 hypothetical protein Y886_07745 [Xanthomonas hyacinthi DSM 19077]
MLIESLHSACHNLAAHRLRSTLTVLGVVIGAASVVTVVALLQGLTDSVSNQFAEMGSGVLSLQASNDFGNYSTGNINTLRFEDIDLLRHRAEGVENVAPVMSVTYADRVNYRGRSATPAVIATTSDYVQVEHRYPQLGRFLTPSDDQGHRHVVVIGTKLRDDLRLPSNPTGEFLQIGMEWFKVIGMMDQRGEIFGQSQDNYLMVPFEVGRVLNGTDQKATFSVHFTLRDIRNVESARSSAERAIRAAHKLPQGKEDDFEINAADQLAKQFSKISRIATFVLSGIVGISLLVSGIGIMTVMLISVTERTREIGILKSLGATKQHVLTQFLLEASLLSFAGGAAGSLLGIVASHSIAAMIPGFPAPHSSVGLAAGMMMFSLVTGIFFGIAPALKAANLDPVEALRYE